MSGGLLGQRVQQAAAGGRDGADLDPGEDMHGPQHRIDDGEVMVLDPAAGVLRPEPAVQAALRSAEAAGSRWSKKRDAPVSMLAMLAICSSVSSKSKTSMFSAIRSARTDFGITTT